MTDADSDGADIRAGRLPVDEINNNFNDIHPPLSKSEALIEADRCYFCFDAPCTLACPTGIDIPAFIQKIRSENIRGSAHTILRENIMGGMCARVCPTEVLCEEACVRNVHEDKPVNIGLLQRHATDPVLQQNVQLFRRGPDTGKKVAVVGAGPAGLSCAHRLSMLGHDVVVFNRDRKPGGLNEYGIAAYKAVDDFAQKEFHYILGIGGIEMCSSVALGDEFRLAELQGEFDAVFLGLGLGGVNQLNIPGEDAAGVLNAVDYIAELRQADDKSELPVGQNVVVIGGGMTAIDIAVQSKRLGAGRVDIVYRRGPEQMGASHYEQDFARVNDVTIHHWAQPMRVLVDGHVSGVEFATTALGPDGELEQTGTTWTIGADVVFKAVGQTVTAEVLHGIDEGLQHRSDRILVDADRKTSIDGVWAGGDCVFGNEDLTVSAVQDGKIAAIDIDRYLRGA